MYGLIFTIAVAIWALFFFDAQSSVKKVERTKKMSDQLKKLWEIAHKAIDDKKFLRAEKALLAILKIDERNATAYNRLGILYAKQKEFSDAVDCFEIAQSLAPSPSSLHNVGLIHLELGRYEKARLAFEQALEIDDSHASRHIAYAKVLEKMGDKKGAISAIERAVDIEPSIQSVRILADAYRKVDRESDAVLADKRLEKMITRTDTQKTLSQPRKVK